MCVLCADRRERTTQRVKKEKTEKKKKTRGKFFRIDIQKRKEKRIDSNQVRVSA